MSKTPIMDWIRSQSFDINKMFDLLDKMPNKYAIQSTDSGKYLDSSYNLVSAIIMPFSTVTGGTIKDSTGTVSGFVFNQNTNVVFGWNSSTNVMTAYTLTQNHLKTIGDFKFVMNEWDIPWEYYDKYNISHSTSLRPMSPDDVRIAQDTYLLGLRMNMLKNTFPGQHCLPSDSSKTGQSWDNAEACCRGSYLTVKFGVIDIPGQVNVPLTQKFAGNCYCDYNQDTGYIKLYSYALLYQRIAQYGINNVQKQDENYVLNPERFNGKWLLIEKYNDTNIKSTPRIIKQCIKITAPTSIYPNFFPYVFECYLENPSGFPIVDELDSCGGMVSAGTTKCGVKDSDGYITTWTIGSGVLALDSRFCQSDWCPFSRTCAEKTTAFTDYCSSITKDGAPMLNTDQSCVAWCSDLNYGGLCGNAAGKFCSTFTNKKPCACQGYTKSPEFQEAQQVFQAIPGCEACKVIPDPVCWAEPCTVSEEGPDRTLLTTSQRQAQQGCKGLTLNFCNQVIDIINSRGDVHVDNNTFNMVCGTDTCGNKCKDTEICDSGKCISSQCRSGADCKPGETCQNGKCVASSDCTSDQDCQKYGKNYVCKNGFCSVEHECNIDSDCSFIGDGYVCNNGTCELEKECDTSKDCDSGLVCKDGMCIKTPNWCNTNSDCHNGYKCVNGICTKIKPPSGGGKGILKNPLLYIAMFVAILTIVGVVIILKK